MRCESSLYLEVYCEGSQQVMKNLEVLLVQGIETVVMFKRQRQYSLLFGRLEDDQRRVCELQRSVTAPLASTLTST